MKLSDLILRLQELQADGFGDLEVDGDTFLADVEEAICEQEAQEEEEEENDAPDISAELAAHRAKWGY